MTTEKYELTYELSENEVTEKVNEVKSDKYLRDGESVKVKKQSFSDNELTLVVEITAEDDSEIDIILYDLDPLTTKKI